MGYEPITNCAYCGEASDVYQPGWWLCDGCAEMEKEGASGMIEPEGDEGSELCQNPIPGH